VFVVCSCCVGDVAGCGRQGDNSAKTGGAKPIFFEEIDFCESGQKQYNPNENQIYEQKWDYFVCQRGGC
jgi:hypothetical protein